MKKYRLEQTEGTPEWKARQKELNKDKHKMSEELKKKKEEIEQEESEVE